MRGSRVAETDKGASAPPAAPRPSRRLLVASTSIDLIDLSEDSSSDHSRYSSFNPGYKSTTPTDDLSLPYPATSVTLYEESNLPVLHEIFEGPTAAHLAHIVSGANSDLPANSIPSLEDLVKTGLWQENKGPAPRASWAGPSGPSPPPLPPRPRSTTPNIQHMESPAARSPQSPLSADSSPRSPCPSEDSCKLPSFVDVRPRSHSSSHGGRLTCAPEDRPLPPPPPTDRPSSPFYWELERPSSGGSRSKFKQHLHAPVPVYSHHAEQILRQAKLRKERQAKSGRSHNRTLSPVPNSEVDVKSRHSRLTHCRKEALALKKECFPQTSSHPQLSKWNTHSEVWIPQVKHSHSVPCHVKDITPDSAHQHKAPPRNDKDRAACEEGKSQSCELLPGTSSLRRDCRRNKRRCPTPPRVLSPSLDNVECHVVADI